VTDLRASELTTWTGRISRRTGTLWRRTANGVVILSPTGSHPIRLDATGAMVWAEMEQTTTLDAIVSALTELYQAEPVHVRDGVESILAALDHAGALHSTNGATGL
jgi:hypothetical protein